MDLNQLEAFFARLKYGRLHRFTFYTDTGFSGYKAELILRGYAVPVYGREIVAKNQYGFRVTEKQARWAEYLLCKAGVPLSCATLDQKNAKLLNLHKRGHMPTPWQKKNTIKVKIIGRIMDFMDWILP